MSACAACGTAGQLPGAKFCHGCGAQLLVGCASCGAALAPGARFCSECGAPQADAVGPAPRDPHPTGTRSTSSSERRVTSILFGDLVGFTSLAEGLDQEDARDVLSRFFEGCRRIIERYGGTVEKFIGDAVMAVWGVPTAHEDDAERAVRAGLELTRMVPDLGSEVGVDGLSMRIGVVTGEVAATIGAEHEGMVAGDPVNTASRVQSVAKPGEVWVDRTTRNLTSAAISYADAGRHELKGKTEPVSLWSARAVVGSARGGQRADGLEAPFVGRDRELRVVKELFHSTIDASRPGLLVVDGDPGMGKTRLGWELFKYTDGLPADTFWHQGRCLAYGDGVAYWALAEAVRLRLARAATSEDGDLEGRIDLGLQAFVPDEEERSWIRPRLAALLGVGSVATFAREDLFSAWVTFIERVGAGQQVVLLIDDAQHADEGLLSFTEYLLGTATFPCLVVLLTRPGLLEAHPSLATNRRSTILHLAPLGDADMGALVDGLVAGMPREVSAALVERCEGIPLYAVETVRSLIDRDHVVPRGGEHVLVEDADLDLKLIAAPPSLQALVAARLDALSPDERQAVNKASILGSTFKAESLGHLCTELDVQAVLDALVRVDILARDTNRVSAEFGQYRFVQSVVRQVAYSTLSKRDRKAGHVAAAEFLASLGEEAGDVDSVVARHYLDAIEAGPGDPDVAELEAVAVRLLSRAARRAQGLGAPAEAVGHLRLALERTSDPDLRAGLQSELAACLDDLGQAQEAIEHAQLALGHFDQVGDGLAAARAAARAARPYVALGDYDAALALTGERLAELRDRDDAAREVLLLLRVRLAALGRLGVEERDLEDLWLRLADRLGDKELLADAYTTLAIRYGTLGAPSLSRALLVAAADLAREHHLTLSRARTLTNLTSDLNSWDLRRAVECGRESVEAARRAGPVYWRSYAAANLALSAANRGLWDEVEEVLADAVEVWDSDNSAVGVTLLHQIADARSAEPPDLARITTVADDPFHLVWVRLAEALAARRDGSLTSVVELVSAVEQFVELSGVVDDMVTIWPPVVEMARALGDDASVAKLTSLLDDAGVGLPTGLRAHREEVAGLSAMEADEPADVVEGHLRSAVELFDEWGGTPARARTEEVLGAWLVREGRVEEGNDLLDRARAAYGELRATGWLKALEEARRGADPHRRLAT